MQAFRPLPRLIVSRKPSSYGIRRHFLHRTSHRAQDAPKSGPPARTTSNSPTASASLSSSKLVAGNLPAYTEDDYTELSKKYTPEQIDAIREGEAAVDAEDVLEQGAMNHGPMTLDYLDDFATIRPIIDKQPKAPEENYDPTLRFKSEDELAEDLTSWIADLPEEIDPVEWQKFTDKTRLTVGKAEAELNPRSSEAPELRKIDDPLIRQQVRGSRALQSGDDMDQHYAKLSKITGIPINIIKKLRTKVLLMKRVVNQTHMGKISSMYYLTVAGNGDGLLGVGEGKGQEPENARRQALMNAIRNLTPIPRYERRTIYGDIKGKMGATELELFNRPPGFGLRCQARIYEMCKCAGISDMGARVTRARNPMNTVKAAFEALTKQRDPEELARARGRKLVDLRHVYYAGNT